MDGRDLFVLLLMLLFYFGQLYFNQFYTEISGHWHLSRIDKEGGYSTFKNYPAISIGKDSMISLGECGGIEGKLFDEGILRIGPTCFGFSGAYEFKNGTLIIYEKRYDEKDAIWVGRKHNPNLCDKQKGFFHFEKVEIDLPILKSGKMQNDMEASLETRFYYGIPKPEFQEEFGNWPQLQLRHHLEEFNDFALAEEKSRIKVVEGKRNRMHRVIYTDKNTPISTLYPLIEYFRKHPKKKVYLATRSADKYIGFKVFYDEVDIFDSSFTPDNSQSIKDWLFYQ